MDTVLLSRSEHLPSSAEEVEFQITESHNTLSWKGPAGSSISKAELGAGLSSLLPLPKAEYSVTKCLCLVSP